MPCFCEETNVFGHTWLLWTFTQGFSSSSSTTEDLLEHPMVPLWSGFLSPEIKELLECPLPSWCPELGITEPLKPRALAQAVLMVPALPPTGGSQMKLSLCRRFPDTTQPYHWEFPAVMKYLTFKWKSKKDNCQEYKYILHQSLNSF